MANNPSGSEISLGVMFTPPTGEWNFAKFILSGQEGSYIGTNPPTNWMQTMLSVLGARPLRRICLPGSHDSGMSTLTNPTNFSSRANTQTQTLDIGAQLASGVRYFDIRCTVSSGVYGTGHWDNTGDILGWQGASGQAMSDIITQVNQFTASNAELIIFDLSHAMDVTDVHSSNTVSGFSPAQWTGLLTQLQGVNNRCTAITDLTTDASTLTLSTYIGNGNASVLFVIRDSTADLTSFIGQGFIQDSQLPVFNSYSDSDDSNQVISDQLAKLAANRTSPDSGMFMLSWTLTLVSAWENVNSSILDNTFGINHSLFKDMWQACSSSTYPNIIDVDGYDSSVAALAIAINNYFGANP
jgi:hypothetical protein